MINKILKSLEKISMSDGRYFSDKSYKYDTIFFVSRYLYDLANESNSIDLSSETMNSLIAKIKVDFSLPEDSQDSNRNYILETLGFLQYAHVISKESQTFYKILNRESLEFITVSIENSYIFLYLVAYQTFKNDGLWDLYLEYLSSKEINEKKNKLLEIKNIMCAKSSSIGDPNSIWASNVVKFSIMVLGLANGDNKISRTLDIKEDKITPKDLSANVEGTRTKTTIEKNNFYIRNFRLNYVKEVLNHYIYGSMAEVEDDSINSQGTLHEFDFKVSTITDGQNLIVYGTPGCGKSYYVEHTLLDGYPKENYIRTTFYQDYTNTDFVGQILPVVEGDKVTYKFNPGPFTLALEQAIRKPNERIALVIEELNRGSAASIFGDIFQLLDRKEGVSEYGITNVNIINYLKEKFEGVYTFKEIRLPGNLSIYATMNTSDQNVFTLDTAFKRRWKFKKLINEFSKDHKFKDKYIPGANITWEDLVNAINEYILECSSGLNSEDKQIGVYFVNEKGMSDKPIDKNSRTDEDNVNIENFAYKVLEYLWSDVAKFDRSKWFTGGIKSLDELVKEYKNKGLEVFVDGIFNK